MSDEAQYTDDEIVASAFGNIHVALVEYWKEQGVEFDALKTRIELETFSTRLHEAAWRKVRALGMKHNEIKEPFFLEAIFIYLRIKLEYPSNEKIFQGYRLLGISVCDMYRIIDAIENLSDEYTRILSYSSHVTIERKGDSPSDYEEVEKYVGRFLPQKYFKKRTILDVEIDHIDNLKLSIKTHEIAKELADLIDENIKFELEPGASIRVIRRDESGSTLDKRTYSGDIPGANVLVLSECAISDFNITIPAEKVEDENAAVAVITNNLTGRSLQMKGISDGKKRLIKSGHNFTLHGHDMKTDWVLALIEEKDDA